MNIASIILAAASAVAPIAPQPEGEPTPPQKAEVVAEAALPPWLPAVLLLSAPCPTQPDGQVIIATHSDEGAIQGCWVRAMGQVFIVWSDGMGSIYTEDRFQWKPLI